MAIASESGSAPFADRAAKLRCIDTEIHDDPPNHGELWPFLPEQWHRWLDNGDPGFTQRRCTNTDSGRMDDVVREADGLCVGDPARVIKQLIANYRIEAGIPTGDNIRMSVQHSPRCSTALDSAYDDWPMEKRVRPHACFEESFLSPAQDCQTAERDDPRPCRPDIVSTGGHAGPIYSPSGS